MEISKDKITLKYQTAEEYCPHCNHEFEKPEYGDEREFDITLHALFHYAGWETLDRIYDEEVNQIIEEYLYDTIRYFACDSHERIKINEEDMANLKQRVAKTIADWRAM